jgi:hypothetical protein
LTWFNVQAIADLSTILDGTTRILLGKTQSKTVGQPGQIASVINGFVETRTLLHSISSEATQFFSDLLRLTHYSIPCTGVKTGWGDSWSDKGVEFDA